MTPQPKPTRAPRNQARKRIRTRRPIGTKRREAKAAGDVTEEQKEAIWKAYGGLCAYYGCFRKAEQWDHIKAIARGGRHTAGNLAPICPEDNYLKGTSPKWFVRLKAGHPYRKDYA